jgi:hypothetical protein
LLVSEIAFATTPIPTHTKISHRREQLIDVERFQGGLEVLAAATMIGEVIATVCPVQK